MLKKKPCILSKRFEDDGKSEEYLTRSVSLVVRALREDLVSGRLVRDAHDKCPLCLKTESLLIARKDRQGLPMDTLICEGCGLIFSASYFDNRSSVIYNSTYCNQIKNRGRSAEEMFKARINPAAFSWLRYNWLKDKLGERFSKINTVMEIGCNDGCNLYPYSRDGLQVFGCDYDEDRMNAGRAAGLTLFKGGAEELERLPVKADLVILSHVLEHMSDVDNGLKEARNLLNDEGMIYIEVPGLTYQIRPNAYKLCDDWITTTNNFLSQLQLEHNYFFDWETLTRFASRNGLVPLFGDGYVRALFLPGEKSNGHPDNDEGKSVLQILSNIEKDWQESNPLWKRTARTIKRHLWKLKR